MKKDLIFYIFLLFCQGAFGQDHTAAINTTWGVYARDTNLTYDQIVTKCDSMFALAGYADSMQWKKDSNDQEGLEEGGPYVKYQRWKAFWAHRYDVGTGKMHDISADIIEALSSQNKTTSTSNCAGTSALQSSITSGPVGWEFIGPRNVSSYASAGYGNSIQQFLGQVNDVVVNPANTNQVYIRDQWGGVWKTNNATAAPGNTWTCLTDNLPHIAGIGVTDFYVEFASSGPHRIFCVVGSPYQASLPNISGTNPRTVGLFYSTDDGATFSQMDVSAIIPDFSSKPILDMAYWPGNSSSAAKYMFITTPFQIYRLDITNPASITHNTIIDIESGIPNTAGERHSRFRGFINLAFDNDPTVMYVTTRSNYGDVYGNTAAIYRIPNCNSCTICGIQYIPTVAADILGGKGNFDDAAFPYGGWMTWGWRVEPLPAPHLETTPDDTASRVEMTVYGSYLHAIDYDITFTLTLPPHTEVDVVLKDVHTNNIYGVDWGTSTSGPPVFTGIEGYYAVGPGLSGSGGTPVAGHYRNDGSAWITHTVVATSVHAADYVSRLEFGSYKLPGYTGGDIEMDNVTVTQQYDNGFKTLRGSPTAADGLFCLVTTGLEKFRKITSVSGTPTITDYNTQPPIWGLPSSAGGLGISTPDFFTISAVNPNIIYFFRSQTSDDARILKFDLTTTSYINDPYTAIEMHPDVRSIFALPNATGTDDILYVGSDGGIARGTFDGHWTNLNGSGLRTSWANDVGSSLFTGQVGMSATDNGVFWSESGNHLLWKNNINGDGGQLKYGRSNISKVLRFEGYTGGGPGYTSLSVVPFGSTPSVNSMSVTTGNVIGLSKMVNTNNCDFFGVAQGRKHVYRLKVTSGSGTPGSPYDVEFDSLTRGPGYSIRQAVQAIGADMIDPNYVVIYMHDRYYEKGWFAYTTDATATTPTWTFKENSAAQNAPDVSLTTLVVDPQNHSSGKRLWAGASGYDDGTLERVFQSVNGGTSWQNISYGLPKGPINALEYDEGAHYLFAGTDQGVYAFNVEGGPNGAGNPWVCYSLNLPNMFVTGLSVNRCTGKIYASSYGRGVYRAELPPTYVETIPPGPTVVWSQDRHQFRNVYVPSGATLLISGCNVYMGRDMSIKVATGGKLIVDGSTITNNCTGCMWTGITAMGNPALSQSPASNQGWVVLRNHSTIANARFGVTNCDLLGTAPLTTTGGIIQASYTKFLNNHNSVTMMPYYAPTGPYWVRPPDLSYFNVCTFLNTTDYRGYAMSYPMRYMVNLNGILGVKFGGCKFINRDWRLYDMGEGVGINSFNSSFNVVSYCTSLGGGGGCSDLRRSYFSGLEDGIALKETFWNSGTTYIDQADFDSSSVGVLVSGQNMVSITRSGFIVGRGNMVDTSIASVSKCGNIGIVVLNAPVVHIEGNTFLGRMHTSTITYPSYFYKYGIVVANSGLMGKHIHRNSFDSLTEGVRAVGNNRGGMSDALRITCNAFAHSTADIVVKQDGAPGPQGIGPDIGSFGYPVRNTFNASASNIINSGLGFTYNFRSAYTATERPSGTPTGVTMLGGPEYIERCAPGFTPGDGGTFGGGGTSTSGSGSFMTSLDHNVLSTRKAAYFSKSASFDSLLDVYFSTLDAGGSIDFYSYIDTATDEIALYNLLLSASPWLSEDVVTYVPTSPILSYDHMDSILTKNPEALRKPGVLDALVEFFTELQANNPGLPDYVASLVYAASNEVTSRTDLESAIFDAGTQRSDAAHSILFALSSPLDTTISVYDTTGAGICTDSNSVYYTLDSNSYYYGFDSLITWLEHIGGPFSADEQMGFYISCGEFDKADSIFKNVNPQKLPKHDRASRSTLSKMWPPLYYAFDKGRSFYNLDDSDIGQLDTFTNFEIAYNRNRQMLWNLSTYIRDVALDKSSYSTATSWAASTSTPYLANPTIFCVLSLSSSSDFKGGGANDTRKHIVGRRDANYGKVYAYPNPSKGNVTFEYKVPQSLASGPVSIVVTNILGEKVWVQQLSSNEGRVVWKSGALASGIYIYQVSTSRGIVGTGKVILNK